MARTVELVTAAGKLPIVWQEAFDHASTLPHGTVVQVWKWWHDRRVVRGMWHWVRWLLTAIRAPLWRFVGGNPTRYGPPANTEYRVDATAWQTESDEVTSRVRPGGTWGPGSSGSDMLFACSGQGLTCTSHGRRGMPSCSALRGI